MSFYELLVLLHQMAFKKHFYVTTLKPRKITSLKGVNGNISEQNYRWSALLSIL